MAQVRSINFKIGNMRKAVDWTVYPASRTAGQGDPTLFVQSDKRALSINLTTKKGMLSNGKGHPGFISVMKFLGATEVSVPDEIIALCLGAQPKSGDTLGSAGSVVVQIA
jgi:hypothetical protein